MSTTKSSASKKHLTKLQNAAPGAPIEVYNRQRFQRINRKRVARLAHLVLERIGRAEATLAITFIRDSRMRELNRDFRGLDAPTDVLSFAYHESRESGEPLQDADHLGDLVISTETAARYARELSLGFAREIDYLVIHGTLHLAGYDHETDSGQMSRLERKLRKELLPQGP